MKPNKIVFKFLVFLMLSNFTGMFAQGDQMLDGIGETGLIARYTLNGHLKDWSRNNLHAKIMGGEAKFVGDSLFNEVISLSGKNYISLPAEILSGAASLSITGWIKLNSAEKGQYFFDFGRDQQHHFFLAPLGTEEQSGYLAEITDSDYKTEAFSAISEVEVGQWAHLAVILDVPSKQMHTFINGVEVSTTELMVTPDEIFSKDSAENQFYIGKSFSEEKPFLEASLYDFRLYRIPLNENQIARIYNNALKKEDSGAVNEREEPDNDLPQFSRTSPQLYNAYLTAVSNVEVATALGNLPELPRYVEATYNEGMEGPPVRVLWPSPEDNEQVLQPGTYTITGRVTGTNFQPKATIHVQGMENEEKPDRKLEAFPLNQVTLSLNNEGQTTKFIENRNKFIDSLAATNPDSFLYMFRNAFGQEQPEGAEPLGVWDSQETKLRGHATGHYLSAIAQAYASTAYDKQLQANFANKMDYMVEVLYKLAKLSGKPVQNGEEFNADPTTVPTGPGKEMYSSDLSETGIRSDYWNWGEGFISAYPPDQFIMLEQGAVYGTEETKIWAPYYTLHKIMAGLMDIYEVSGNRKALEIAEGMGDWVYARLTQLPTETLIDMWNRYIAGEFGGMNEAMAHLYRITDKEDYLKTAQLFDNIQVFFGDAAHTHGLARNVDTFRGLHANQHIPQIMGALEIYRDSKNAEYFKVAENFWNKVTGDYMYSIGGVAGARNPANAECFVSEPGSLYENGFSSGGQNETCATYNMLKLSRGLFFYQQRAELMDYYERGLYNHILASVAEDSPANTYHVPLRPGSEKTFSNADMSGFTCCNGTALESSTKLQNSIYFKSMADDALYVNLFIPSTLEWTEKMVKVKQKTNFPEEDHTRLEISGNGKFDLNIRVPNWATEGFTVQVNGKIQNITTKPGSYLSLNRSWKDGDVIELKMPFQFHLDPVMDQQNIASLFYGPILLAAQENEARKEWRKVSFDAKNISKSIKRNPESLEFTIDGIIFKPFYETYGRHSVYLDVELK